MHCPSKKEFIRLSKKANIVPVYREIVADLTTPVSVYLKVREKYSYLLESVEGEEKIARFSFIGIRPSLVFKSKGDAIEIIRNSRKERIKGDPFKKISDIMRCFKPATVKGMPRFSGGFVGFIGYDMVRFIEKLPDKNPDSLNIEDIVLVMADTCIIFDHFAHRIKIVANTYIGKSRSSKSLDRIYNNALKEIDKIVKKLSSSPAEQRKKKKKRATHRIKSNFTKHEFESVVRKIKEYIRKGDIIQAVPSQRFYTALNCDTIDVYRALRSINPSSYMYYLDFDDIKIIGASPELLVRCENGKVETRPIAGTRPRGSDEAEDERLAKELLRDPKERAEHVMLVDLGRNDIGKVCRAGSVKVDNFMFVEKYSHVMHIVSNCVGYLKKGKDVYDVLRATFPAGTVTGAPKIRAMEIIDELENTRRGPYAGAVGYFSFSGNMDTCINIRTIVVKSKNAYIQAGAGIVADSVPSNEYRETVNKAKAMIKAIEIAERGLE